MSTDIRQRIKQDWSDNNQKRYRWIYNKLTNETRMSYSNTQSRITSQSVEEEDDEEIPELIELN
jgi:hypothetical protein